MNLRTAAWPLAMLMGCVHAETEDPMAGDDADAASDDAASDDAEPEPESVRFFEDVAPILAESCNGCHREGGVAPFALETYEDAAAWAEAIAVVTEARAMPPWNVNNDGSCHTYADARWLEDEQIAILRAWADAGVPEGDASLGMPNPPEPASLVAERIVELGTPDDYLPRPEGSASVAYDDYQCFLLDPGLAEDAFLVGFDVRPGDPRTVHHVLAFNVDPARATGGGRTNAQAMADLDAASPDQLGWDCFAAAGDGVTVEGVPVTWAPGSGATHYPDGTGIRVRAGQQIVVQMHYSLVDAEPVADGTTVRLALADTVEREATMVLVDGYLMTLLSGPELLAPGEESVEFSWEMPLNAVPYLDIDLADAELLGILPHMHKRGRRMSIEVVGDTGSTCAGDVDRWDFDWQQAYFYDDPIPVTGSHRLAVTCEWDTRGDTEPVGPGFGTSDEMCLVGLYVAQRD